MLEQFCGGVQARMKRIGFDWTTLLTTLLPMVVQLIQECFNKAADLQAFAGGRRGPLQMARLRSACRQVVQEQGVRGVFRVSSAASDLQAAILAELDETASKAAGSGSVYDEAIEEAFRY